MPDTDLTTSGLIRLDIPADHRYLTTARLVAASAGADAGFSVDDLEDLRLGVDELVALLIARARNGARVTLAVRVTGAAVVISGEVDGEVDPADPTDELSERIVAAVVDNYELTERAFRLEKSPSNRAG